MSQDEAKGFREGTKEQTHTRGSSMAGDAPTPHLGTPCHTEGHQDWINIQVERQSHGTARAFDHQNIQEDLYKLLPLEEAAWPTWGITPQGERPGEAWTSLNHKFTKPVLHHYP